MVKGAEPPVFPAGHLVVNRPLQEVTGPSNYTETSLPEGIVPITWVVEGTILSI